MPGERANSGGRSIQAVEKAFTIIDTLNDVGRASASELAAELDMAVSTVYIHLKTLTEVGYVKKTDDEYYLGLKFLQSGGRTRRRWKVFTKGRKHVDALASRVDSRFTARLSVEESGYEVVLYRTSSEQAVGSAANVTCGQRNWMHTTAAGQAILSKMSEEDVVNILDRHGLTEETEYTITSRSRLFEELNRIDADGYALENEERICGHRGVAAPLTDYRDRPIGALAVAGPKEKIEAEAIIDLLEPLSEMVNLIQLEYDALEVDYHEWKPLWS